MDVAKREDQLLDKISALIVERDIARMELATEKVAHRVTQKELSEVVGMALK
jgi:hypothetical protein